MRSPDRLKVRAAGGPDYRGLVPPDGPQFRENGGRPPYHDDRPPFHDGGPPPFRGGGGAGPPPHLMDRPLMDGRHPDERPPLATFEPGFPVRSPPTVEP